MLTDQDSLDLLIKEGKVMAMESSIILMAMSLIKVNGNMETSMEKANFTIHINLKCKNHLITEI